MRLWLGVRLRLRLRLGQALQAGRGVVLPAREGHLVRRLARPVGGVQSHSGLHEPTDLLHILADDRSKQLARRVTLSDLV
eukprot:COSAG04_NODE_1272_length_7468_cov_3.407518_4_plen_80_part_00